MVTSSSGQHANVLYKLPNVKNVDERKAKRGTLGEKIYVKVNHFQMKVALATAFHYDVSVSSLTSEIDLQSLI